MPAPKKDKLQPEPDECYNEGRNWEAELYPRGEGYWRCGIPGLKYSTERLMHKWYQRYHVLENQILQSLMHACILVL